jgi:hypothetical protein
MNALGPNGLFQQSPLRMRMVGIAVGMNFDEFCDGKNDFAVLPPA